MKRPNLKLMMVALATTIVAVDRVAAEAAVLVAGLPVRLQEEVAHQVRGDEDGEDFDPDQDRGPAAALMRERLCDGAGGDPVAIRA